MADLERLAAELGLYGLCARGVLEFDQHGWLVAQRAATALDAVLCADGRAARILCLVGYRGGAIWPHFERWRLERPHQQDPLDAWSKAVIGPIAEASGGEAVFPSDRPWQPFQQWAMAAEGLRPSPLGMLIDPVFGLWHGYRGAILFGESAAQNNVQRPFKEDCDAAHPCDICPEKPCLTACPVEAFTPTGFEAGKCRTYLKTGTGVEGCMKAGCRARDACPVGRAHRYSDAQIRFHMAAFG